MAKAAPVSPLAPKTFAELPALDGVRLADGRRRHSLQGPHRRAAGGVRRRRDGRGRLHHVQMPVGAGRLVPQESQRGKARALVVNSGNANAFTGKVGKAATELTAKLAAKAVGAEEDEIFLASTGVIGEPLDASKFEGVLDALAAKARARRLARRRQGDHDHRHVSRKSRPPRRKSATSK